MPENEITQNDGWNDEHCMVRYSLVCEVYPNGSPFTWTDPYNWPSTGGCMQGWAPFGGLCYAFANSIPGQQQSLKFNRILIFGQILYF